jgi:hypothetical protein
MSEIVDVSREDALFSYVIASGEMHYIEINQREIYLRRDSSGGYIVSGEIPGCGSSCHADLSQIFLEFAITCEGCKQEAVVLETAVMFGERLGKLLVGRLAAGSGIQQFCSAYGRVLVSMNAAYTLQEGEDLLRYSLAECPLRAAAVDTGLSRGIPTAQAAFIALTSSLLGALAPDWKLLKPTDQDLALPLLEVVMSRKELP